MPSEPPAPPPPPPPGPGAGATPRGRPGIAPPPGPGTALRPGPEGPHPGAAAFREPRRLHPASVLLGIPLTQLVQALFFPVAATLAAPAGVTLGLLGTVAVVGLVARALDWRLRTYSFDGEVLRVDHGVLSRNHRSLDVARIQQVEIQRGAIQRLVGLAAIRVETAGSASEPEVDLRVVPEADAVALRAAVRASQARLQGSAGATANGDGTTAPPGEAVLEVPLRHVVLASVTGARLLVLPAVAGALLQFVGNQVGPFLDELLERAIETGLAGGTPTIVGPGWRIITLAIVATLLLAIVTAIVVGILRDANFRIERHGEDLHISRGLLSTRDSVVPLRRVQLVEIQRNWLRRALGYTTVRVRSAGGSASGDGRVTVPLLPAADVDELLGHLLPNVPGVPPLTAHPPAALRRALFRWLRPPALLLVIAYGLPALVPATDIALVETARPYLWLLLPLTAVLAAVEYRHLAHAATPLVVVARSGALSITTQLAPVVKVQALTSRRSPFQRRLGLTTLLAHVAGPGALVTVLDADRQDATELHERLTGHAASPIPVVPERSAA
ncbi:MAG: PH domain-containing protein [Nitriliruptoraceae bacterium]